MVGTGKRARVAEMIDEAAFDELTPVEVRRALLDNFTGVGPACVAATLATMDPERAAAFVEVMSLGVDAPPEMARILPHVSETALRSLLACVHPASLARLAREMELDNQARILSEAGRDTAAALLAYIAEGGGRVADARAARMLSQLSWQAQTAILECLDLSIRTRLMTALRRLDAGPLPSLSRCQACLYLAESPLEEVVFALTRSAPDAAADALATLDAPRAAAVLTAIAASNPALAVALLRGLDTDTLVGFSAVAGERIPRWEPFARASASIVAELDLQAPPVLLLLRLLPAATLEAIIGLLSSARCREILDLLGRHRRKG